MRVVAAALSYTKLLSCGYSEVEATNPQQWWDVGYKLRRRMVGRIYTEKLVRQAGVIAMKYADNEQRARFAPFNQAD